MTANLDRAMVPPAASLQTKAAEARERYALIGRCWLTRFGIVTLKEHSGLYGRAIPDEGEIKVPWPATSRKRLYIVAHEIGHIALHGGKWGRLPRYVKEFEAELFALGLMKQAGVPVPRAMLDRAKRYVRRMIGKAHRRMIRYVDPDIAAWAKAGSVKGINFWAPDRMVKDYHGAARRRVAAALEGRKL